MLKSYRIYFCPSSPPMAVGSPLISGRASYNVPTDTPCSPRHTQRNQRGILGNQTNNQIVFTKKVPGFLE